MDFFKNLIVYRWQYKLLALVTAIVLWFYVVKEQNLNIVLNVPIEFYNYPSNLKIINEVRNSVDLYLTGRRDIMNNINKRNIKVVINLKKAKAGRNVYIITSRRIKNLPRGVRIIDIAPARIIIEFKKIQQEKEEEGKK